VCSVMCLDLGVAALEIVERCSGSFVFFWETVLRLCVYKEVFCLI